jgi:STELLO glycosyltransferases
MCSVIPPLDAFPTALVVTSINAPTPVMRALRDGCRMAGFRFLVIGDTKSPRDFALDGCEFLGVDEQVASNLAFAKRCPTAHYARKNIGYLIAIRGGARLILETDDDNIPRAAFFAARERFHQVKVVSGSSWINLYRYFTEVLIWPRGLPLEAVNGPSPPFDALPVIAADCPIQQGLADANPDVDAIYRLLLPLPQNFRRDRRIALGPGAWCPFNSQNTAWWPDAFPMLYLPAYCSFRMTDIWRSFIAQRIASINGWHVLFHEATVWQERNEHNLMRDFAEEVPGYLNNGRIREALENLPLAPGLDRIPDNLRSCYKTLVELELIGPEELPLLDAWLDDLMAVASQRQQHSGISK